MKESRHSGKYAQLLEVLRQTRKNAGLTQTEVGLKFGTHASFVSKVESGERRIDVIELAAFCRIYVTALFELLEQVGIT